MSNRVDFVVKKYRLDELSFVDQLIDGVKLGHGKIMSDTCLAHFIAADPSGDNKYLDWMLFMAGGGQEAMEKSLLLWHGETPSDENSLRNMTHRDFIAEQVQGYTDDAGVRHEPISTAQAESNWREMEPRFLFEFVMGDQDIAAEEGYGFYREWPGNDRCYEKIVNVVKLWHDAQPKLLLKNQSVVRAARLRSTPYTFWTDEDKAFLTRFSDDPVKEPIELDIYAKWKPKEYSQKEAVYCTLDAVLMQLSDIRRAQILKDDRHEVIYEDDVVRAIAPLTVGASLKYGSSKWCVSNRSEFDRSVENNAYVGGCNWKNYVSRGPLVYFLFKVPMPLWCSKLAVHILTSDLAKLETALFISIAWFDVENAPNTSYHWNDIARRIAVEHMQLLPFLTTWTAASVSLTEDEKVLALAGRAPGRAWDDLRRGAEVTRAVQSAIAAVSAWGRTFDVQKLVIDYLADSGGVIKSNE